MLKKSVVIKAKRLKPLKIDYKTTIFFTFFICGIILGISFIKNGDTQFNNFIENLIENINITKSNNSFLSCLFYVSGWLFVIELIIFLSGLSGVGIPIIAVICLIYGSVCGIFCGGYYLNYSLEGIGFFALINLPCYAITAATLIKCCCESARMSLNIFLCLNGGNMTNTKNKKILKDYILYYLILSLPLIVGAILNVASFKVFSGLFSSIIIS